MVSPRAPAADRGAYQTPPQSKLMYSNAASRSRGTRVQQGDGVVVGGGSKAGRSPVTKEAAAECGG